MYPVDFHKQELLEWSVVNIGANRNARAKDVWAEAKSVHGIDTTPLAKFLGLKLDTKGAVSDELRPTIEALYFEHRSEWQKSFQTNPEGPKYNSRKRTLRPFNEKELAAMQKALQE